MSRNSSFPPKSPDHALGTAQPPLPPSAIQAGTGPAPGAAGQDRGVHRPGRGPDGPSGLAEVGVMRMPFGDRLEAGRVLATKLDTYANRPDMLVLALPRGGVPVGFEV